MDAVCSREMKASKLVKICPSPVAEGVDPQRGENLLGGELERPPFLTKES